MLIKDGPVINAVQNGQFLYGHTELGLVSRFIQTAAVVVVV